MTKRGVLAATAGVAVVAALAGCKEGPAWRDAPPSPPPGETYPQCYNDRSNRPCVAGTILWDADGTARQVIVLWEEPNGRVRVVRE